jgi:hypothetical protein
MRYKAPPAEEVTNWFVGYLMTPHQFKSLFLSGMRGRNYPLRNIEKYLN